MYKIIRAVCCYFPNRKECFKTAVEKILAESENYYIKACYERAELYSKADGRCITTVGDHYGDPSDALIDKNERLCVTVGCGYIVYLLRPPFEPYTYGNETARWYEGGRSADHTHYIEKVRQLSDDTIELTDENGNIEMIKIFV